MRRVILLMLVMSGCLDDFDRFFIVDGGPGAICNDCAGGTCHDGVCCRGCWDGAMCKSGGDLTACGVNGGACQLCNDHNECTADKCTDGVCGADNLNAGESCHGGTGICVMGECRCGDPGQPCCAMTPSCNGGLACQNGHCGSCGAEDTPCCATGTACAAGRICNAGTNLCELCGGSGQLCCSSQTCGTGLICGSDGHCGACGGMNQPCCTQGNQCQSNLTCGPGMTCQCGGINQACCGGTLCTDDGNMCDGSEACQGTCQHVNGVTCTALDQCHDVGTCDPSNGTCSNPAKSNGSSCSDGNMCTLSDICQSGVCQSGAPLQCQNGQHCVSSTGACVCDPSSCGSGCCSGTQCNLGSADNACGSGGNSCTMCATNQICQGQMCVACGGQGQPCCHGSSACGANLVCDAGSSTCQPCGEPGDLCCAGATCNTAVGLCNGAVCIAKNVWAVGFFTPSGGIQQGVASQWDGSTWSTATHVADAYILYSINGLGANDIWAAGTAYPNGMTQPSQGLAAHFTGVWTPNHLAYNTAVNSSLTGIWDISGSNVWAVGNDTGSFVAQFGTGWQLGRLGMDSAAATWASAANDVWAVGIASGAQGKVAHWTSNANIGNPSITTIPGGYLTSIWGSGAGDVWVGGQNGSGAALFYWPSGYGGTPVTYPISAVGSIMGIWGSGPLDVWAVGSNASQQGVVLHWTNGPSSSPAATIINNATYLGAIWGSGRNDVWAVGQNQNGAVAAHFTGTWSTAIAIPGMRGALGVWGVAR